MKKKYIKLIVALLGVYVFLVVIIPMINSLPYMSELQENSEKWGINTAAFFYTDDISSNPEITKYTDK